MAQAHLFQIFYNEQTGAQLDPGFTPLDNLNNPRPDWFEYIPIRQCLLSQPLEEDDYLGVFSPKFFEKTGMRSHAVREALAKTDAPVVSFSPWYAHISLHRNVFVQAEKSHPGADRIFKEVLPLLGIPLDTQMCVMGSEQAIYCNYFVAKPWVWREWLQLADKLFDLAEDPISALGRRLRQVTSYTNAKGSPMKVFVLERLMSAWLTQMRIRCNFATDLQTSKLGYNLPNDALTLEVFVMLNELKMKYMETGEKEYVSEYEALHQEYIHSTTTL